jgi:hypothetical protein
MRFNLRMTAKDFANQGGVNEPLDADTALGEGGLTAGATDGCSLDLSADANIGRVNSGLHPGHIFGPRD